MGDGYIVFDGNSGRYGSVMFSLGMMGLMGDHDIDGVIRMMGITG